jgi:hypothetical protein
VRLVRRSKIASLNAKLQDIKSRLARQAEIFKLAMPGIVARFREKNAGVFDYSVYSFDPVHELKIDWWFPVIMEDRELAEIDQQIYHREITRVTDELRACVSKCEEEMMEGLFEALRHASEKLESDETGNKKVFQASTVTKLFDELNYIEMQLKDNNIGGTAFAGVSKKLRELLRGQDSDTLPDALRANNSFRKTFKEQCEQVATHLLSTATPEMRRRLLIED